MFKRASDAEQNLDRTGSHATKPLATGRILILPEEAHMKAAVFNEAKDLYEASTEERQRLQEEITSINTRLRTTLPKEEYDRLYALKGHALEMVKEFDFIQRIWNNIAVDAEREHFSCVFVGIATLLLPRDVVEHLIKQSEGEIGKKRRTIRSCDPRSGWNEHKKHMDNLRKKRVELSNNIKIWGSAHAPDYRKLRRDGSANR